MRSNDLVVVYLYREWLATHEVDMMKSFFGSLGHCLPSGQRIAQKVAGSLHPSMWKRD